MSTKVHLSPCYSHLSKSTSRPTDCYSLRQTTYSLNVSFELQTILHFYKTFDSKPDSK